MTSTDTKPEVHRCLRCNRPLRSAESRARRYGAGCWSMVRHAERSANLSAWTPSQIDEAELAIADGAVVPSTRPGVFHVVSVDGTEVHRTAEHGCNCAGGLKTHQPRPCWHRCAVAIMLATSTPASAVPAVSAPIPMAAAPMPLSVPAATSGDVWAALEAVGALDLIPAF